MHSSKRVESLGARDDGVGAAHARLQLFRVEPCRTRVNIEQVEAQRLARGADAQQRVLQLRRYHQLEHQQRGREDAFYVLKQHELPERVVPLHEEQPRGRGAAQVLVPVVRVAGHRTPHATSSIRNARSISEASRQ